MNELGLKQKAILAMLGVIALYAVAVVLWFTTCEASWKKAAKSYQKEAERFKTEEKLIAARNEWNTAYDAAKSEMPVFEAGKATDTTWLGKVGDIARANLVSFARIDPGAEIVSDDVYELPIDISGVEASLEALVKFMHALENTKEGMFAVKAIDVAPINNKRGYLKGTVHLTCAYMRGK